MKTRTHGFTLLELLMVVAIMALATAGVSLAMRDSAQTQLEREAQRLAALLESARAQSRASGVPVRWQPTEAGFRFDGLPPENLPQQWMTPGIHAALPPGMGALPLGPQPGSGAQQTWLSLSSQPGRTLVVATDGLRPFAVRAAE